VTVPVDASSLGTDDVGFIGTLIDTVSGELCIDAGRVYSTGMSNGAGMSVTLACELGDRLAAIAAVSGVNLSGACPGDQPMSVLAIHGRDDTTVPLEGGRLMGYDVGNPGVMERMQAWAQRNGCSSLGGVVLDGYANNVQQHDAQSCRDDTEARLLVIDGMGHVWPRATSPEQPPHVDATALVLDWFDSHPGR
jgi:polyhydroxybutyrate depolymerase